MTMTVDDLRGLGYAVTEAFTGDGFTVWRVAGFGVSIQVRDDDTATINTLADPAKHDERVTQAGEAQVATMRRWVRERRAPPPSVRDVT